VTVSAPRSPVLTFFCWQVAGLALLFCHMGIAVLCGSAAPAYAITLPLVLLIYVGDSMAGFAVFLQFLLYQNLALSMAAGSVDFAVYQTLLGSSFALSVGIAMVAVCRLWSTPSMRRTLIVIAAVLAVVLAYTAIGAMRSSFGSASAYFRTSAVGIFSLLVGWDVGRDHRYHEVGLCFVTSLLLGIALAVCEVAAPVMYYDAIGASDYYRLKYSSGTSNLLLEFRNAQDVAAFVTNTFFNFGDSGLESTRFGGPNMHSVSYAYVIAIGAIVALSLGVYWLPMLVLPLLFLIGVKGAAILLTVTVGLWLIGRTLGGAALCVFGAAFGIAYVTLVISYGLANRDYHVIGLMGGIEGFLANPLGHGIGVGGNLSSSVTSTDVQSAWQDFQRYGADQALESAIGVLLYQMGIGAIAVLWAYWVPFRAAVRDFRLPAGLIPLALGIAVLNGVFQEEAFSPYAIGLLTFFAGVLSSHRIDVAPTIAAQGRYAPA
jgi:hypothetical protein